MKKMYTLMLIASTIGMSAALTGCGAYVGSPPKSEVVHETNTTSDQPAEVVHVYHDDN